MAPPSFQESLPAAPASDLSVEALKRDFVRNLFCRQAKFPAVATRNDLYLALAWTVRDRLLERWIESVSTYFGAATRTVCYLSAEYLLGPQLGNNLLALGAIEAARHAMRELSIDLDELLEHEEEPGLGNGGLGRLAACYMDSLATLAVPAIGYGLRYEFGIFDQVIRDGWQVERTDRWLRYGYPWEIGRPDIELPVMFGGHTESGIDPRGHYRVRWVPSEMVMGVPYDTPVPGYGVANCNFLRLWSAIAPEGFDVQAFNVGDYFRAVEQKVACENITKVLYPNDQGDSGKVLRLKQQYLLVSCSLQDMIRLFLQREPSFDKFPEKFAAQLNDTHPALAVPELMRLLVDEHLIEWDQAWSITTRTFGYTNHTLLPEALETWSLPLFASVLPRHLEIIYEINRRFLDDARRRFPGDGGRIARLSLVDEHGEKRVRMANLATVGSHHVNGVAALHSDLLAKTVLSDFHAFSPEKFTNVTNGVTPRRFLALANPALTRLISEAIGNGWIKDLDEIRRLEPLADDEAFCASWRAVKLENKRQLAAHLRKLGLPPLDPEAMFDVQAKRIHAYKRQHLAVLEVIARWRRLRAGNGDAVPRTAIFAGKAAPGYGFAKLIIRLIHAVADAVNNDPRARGRLRVVFVPDFNVKIAQRIYPAAELSEQISLAGKEASGTGNMKFAMNGALTIGTLDGANIEIRDAVGAENFFLFGMSASEVERRKAAGYRSRDHYDADPALREAIDVIGSGELSGGDRSLFEPIVRSLLDDDEYMLLADFSDYAAKQKKVDETWSQPNRWTRMSILNVARIGAFSSDRAIAEYLDRIWKASPVPIHLKGPESRRV
jgi:glycogen phosphorylase